MSSLVSEISKEAEVRSVILFAKFLENSKIPPMQPVDQYRSLEQIVKENFHLYTEDILRGVIAAALEYRDQNSATNTKANALGDWGLIIDTIKVVLQDKRENAGKNFQELIQFGLAGDQQNVDKYLLKLYRGHHIDHLFIGIIEETMTACQQSGNEENFYMVQYFMNTIESIRENEAKIRQAISKKSTETTTATKPANIPTKEIMKPAAEPPKKPVTTPPTQAPTQAPVAPPASLTEEETLLITVGQFLNELIKRSAGKIQQVQQEMLRILTTNTYPLPVIQRVITDNITACEEAGYTNKVKVFQFLQSVIKKHVDGTSAAGVAVEESLQRLVDEQKQHQQYEQFAQINSYHAPQFVTNNTLYDQSDYTQNSDSQEQQEATTGVTSWKKKLNPVKVDASTCFDGRKIEFYNAPTTSTSSSSSSSATTHTKMNPKKLKATKKLYKHKLLSLIEQINSHMETHGYAVIENFVALELVKRVRIESMLFKEFYEKSEIWIGKEANIGAHLVVPSIRGDQVLWMCGGHNVFQVSNPHTAADVVEGSSRNQQHFAPEGVSRIIKTSGEVEPCKLAVKASAPTRRFHAMKELIHKCDSFVNSLKVSNSHLTGIFERSDAMLAIYPGEGARFANHVDNTTLDGRRVTMVTYLNPEWTEKMGGALRITGRIQRKPVKQPSVTSNTTTTSTSTTATVVSALSVPSVASVAAAVDSDEEGVDENEGEDKEEKLPTIVSERQLLAETAAASAATATATTVPAESVETKEMSEQPVIDVLPIAGRTILFYSSEIPHEVLPTFGDRYAMTVWYYDREERQQAIQQAKDAAAAVAATQQHQQHPTIAATRANMQAQTEAKDFIGLLMGGNEYHAGEVRRELQAEGLLPMSNSTTTPATASAATSAYSSQGAAMISSEELKFLQNKVVNLTQEAIEIVASITGAPSVQSFRDGFAMLTTGDIVNMRALFRKMGLHE